MPTTPFIGLSVVVHLVIIIFSKIFGFGKQLRSPRIKAREPFVTRQNSLTIMASVLIIIFINAAFLVRVVIMEKHSSINLLSQAVQDLTKHADSDPQASLSKH